ncbi:hypothetical protein J6590_076485 [Homalodisca vitripennis]|nr:hypothetical protein J6590_076485 [Homalodisca vitripennis]
MRIACRPLMKVPLVEFFTAEIVFLTLNSIHNLFIFHRFEVLGVTKQFLLLLNAHILKSPLRKVLKRDNDDWFLICYPVSLGTIRSIQLWHDNTGRSADWFCSKVIIYDLFDNMQYIFLVEQWLALEADEFPEAVMRPATVDEILSVKRLFLDNSMSSFRENHLWMSVVSR